jgi:hypothetical protein
MQVAGLREPRAMAALQQPQQALQQQAPAARMLASVRL